MSMHPDAAFTSRRMVMKAWIMRVLAAIAVAGVLSGCAGLGIESESAMPSYDYEVSLSD